MLKKIEFWSDRKMEFRPLKLLAVALTAGLLFLLTACDSMVQSRPAAMIREEVEKNSSFPTKWNGLKVAVVDGDIELWASDFVQGNVRNRVLWIVWKDKGQIEIHLYPVEGAFFVEEAFGQQRPEVLRQALPIANKYLELLHRKPATAP